MLNGAVMPKWHELGVNPRLNTAGYSLHCKPVETLDQDALLALPADDARVTADLKANLAWINDARLYEPARTTKLERSRLSAAETKLQLERKKIEPCATPAGTCKVFKVPEHAKKRFRVIQHPIVANEKTARDTKVTFTSFVDRHRAILRGRYSVDLDWAAFFDQLLMHPDVREFFAFLANGMAYRMRVMPMGLKHSVAVAQLTTQQLLNFPHKSYTEIYIDNVRLLSDDRDDLINDAATLLCRCAEVGVTVNELDVSTLLAVPQRERAAAARALIEPLVRSSADWLGESYDYDKKEITLTDRTKEKVQQCDGSRTPTFRNLAAMFGILLYASRTMGIRLAPYFAARRAMSDIGKLMEGNDHLWDTIAPALTRGVVQSIRTWKRDILAAPPRVISPARIPDLLIITDASDIKWGAIGIEARGHGRFVSEEWTSADRRMAFTKTSTHAESEAIFRAACKLINPTRHRQILIASDSSAAVGAINKGHSLAYHMNDVCRRLQGTFPSLAFELVHTPGKGNPADGISRHAKCPSSADWERAWEIADQAGLQGGWGSAKAVNGTEISRVGVGPNPHLIHCLADHVGR